MITDWFRYESRTQRRKKRKKNAELSKAEDLELSIAIESFRRRGAKPSGEHIQCIVQQPDGTTQRRLVRRDVYDSYNCFN